ncbi:MAG: flagellar basal body P-ring formation chaperone FlgA [Rhodobacteraceae bacterium]|nr:flagellar basal body P-ring formation chaperone FlgA [Paracoccaceae bacterium]
MKTLAFIFWCLAGPLAAQTVMATQAIRSQTVITSEMVGLSDDDTVGAFAVLAAVVGLEARVNIYPGRPIMLPDLGRPAILERNQQVVMIYISGGLSITSEGRVLDRAGVGERVRVMNLASKSIVFGTVTANGQIEVGL